MSNRFGNIQHGVIRSVCHGAAITFLIIQPCFVTAQQTTKPARPPQREADFLSTAIAESGGPALAEEQKKKIDELVERLSKLPRANPTTRPSAAEEQFEKQLAMILTEDQRDYWEIIKIRGRIKKRETAHRVECASHMRKIGLGLLMWANGQKNGSLPPDLGSLMTDAAATGLKVTDFVCPSSFRTVPPDVVSGSAKLQATWVNQNSTYIYTGAGSSSSADSAMILLYERPGTHAGREYSDGMNILFGDGHVEFILCDAALHMISEVQQGHNPPRK